MNVFSSSPNTSAPPSRRWPRPACFRPRPTSRASWSSRRARRATAISRPTRRWCWPRTRAEAARARREDRGRAGKRPEVTKTEIAGPGFINLTLDPAVWREALADGDPRRRGLRPRRASAPASGQCRVRLGQSDRADARRPLPRRGVRRCAGQSAGVRGLRGDARVLHQRRRRAGRCAGALGVPALPRGARREHRRDPGRALSRRLSQAGRRGAAKPSTATSSRASRRPNGCRRCAAKPSR